MSAPWSWIGLAVFGGVGLVGVALGVYVLRNLLDHGWQVRRTRRAGLVEREHTLDHVRLRYAEGPAGGQPLLLIHGQMTDWRSYARVLPALTRRFHVFAVDCPGHGGSGRSSSGYTAIEVAQQLGSFLEAVIQRPAIVAGHSSGGHLAALIGARRPELVAGLLLEDPPLFTTIPPRSHSCWNHVDLSTACHRFLAEGEPGGDFAAYYVAHTRIWSFFGDARERLIQHGLAYRRAHPGRPIRYWFLPPSLNETFRALDDYDPLFGEAFYTGAWNDGFDHAEILSRLTGPTTLVHTNWSYSDDGILQGAMDADDAARAHALLQDATFVRVDSGHAFHFERPRAYVRLIEALADRIAAR